ncbi:MAG: carbohydrate kinase family protein [Candidatus Hodarchaeota archaeon]
MAQEIISIGRINVDIVMQVDKLPTRNEHVTGEEGHISFGGSAANFATQSAHLGVKTGIIGCVGDDPYGQIALKGISNVGVDISSVLVLDKHPTGIFILAEQANGESVVFSEQGANRFLEKIMLDEESIAGARVVHVAGGFPMMTAQTQKITTTNGMIFSFDPGRAAGTMDLTQILRQTDLLFVNERELKEYFKVSPTAKSLRAFAKTLPGVVVLKKGKKGAVATDGFEYCTSQAFETQVVDTLGAGDAFAAGFVTAWTRSENITQALHVGNAVAALTITKKGAQNGQPNLEATNKLLKKNGVNIESILRTFRRGKRKKRQH